MIESKKWRRVAEQNEYVGQFNLLGCFLSLENSKNEMCTLQTRFEQAHMTKQAHFSHCCLVTHSF